ncbi:hypothetical protein Arub01_32790 [Actinomadura rubrobrunea]|uniref:DUF3040 domain-containing protein n=1 Tax=Actinomadura rubrobrunea TaxID=115335 RepID=A0A9W6PV80_9ACTN|nr:DUF3040 domain-containing protein [Actinomadura rubrobrunea]GLW65035.1 hypothetical protein Arub01_32790 [Actinomadura rubrobrunea]
MALSPSERRILDELAERTAAEDPDYARRLATFGRHEPSAPGGPSWRVPVPAVAAGALLAVGFAVAAVAAANLDGIGGRRRGRHRRR